MKKLLMAFLLCAAMSGLAFAQNKAAAFSADESALILSFENARRLDAVRVDFERFIVFHKGNRGFWEDEMSSRLQYLHDQKNEFAAAVLPVKFQLLRTSFIAASDALEAYAKTFLNAAAPEVEKAEELFARRHERLREKLDELAGSVIQPAKLAEDFDPMDEETKAFSDEEGRGKFSKAAFLLEEKRFDLALDAFRELREKYHGKSAEGPIVLRMVRCAIKDHGANIAAALEKEQIRLLADLMHNCVYYPNLYDIFVEWRSLAQVFNYGLAVDVEIPNRQYLKELNGIVQTLKQQVEKNPQDAWARTQLWMLVRLPVIERSGSLAVGAGVDFFATE